MGCFPEPYPRDGFFAQWDKSSGKERSSQCAVTLSQIRKPVPENQKRIQTVPESAAEKHGIAPLFHSRKYLNNLTNKDERTLN